MISDEFSIERALDYHQQGDFNQAADICRRLIKDDPQHVEALQLLGVILSNAGLNDQAIGFFEQALTSGGPNSGILYNYGIALQAQGEFRSATRAFRHAAEAAPLHVDSWYSLGEVELLRDRPEKAVNALDKVLELEPAHVAARILLGVAFRKIGRLEDALKTLQSVVSTDPKNAAAQNNLGITETELAQFEGAKIAFQTALTVAPEYAEAHYNLGNVFLAEAEYEKAAECYLQTLAIEADNTPAIYHLALCRQKQRAYEEALSLLSSLIEAERGGVQQFVQALGSRANVLRDLGRFDAALTDIETALGLAEDDFALLGNKALTLQHANRLNEAIEIYQAALQANPESEQLQTNLAQALLLGGQFTEGWREFEGRLQTPALKAKRRTLPGSAWQGESLVGKHIVLWCEQGLGDTIQFIRYISEIESQAARVTLICPDRLTRLLKSLKTTTAILGESEALPEADFNAPLMSLPHLLALENIPDEGPYLSAEADLVDYWAKMLGEKTTPRIGIAWQGNPKYEADHQRSIPLVELTPLLAFSEVQFVSLQQGVGLEQLSDIDAEILSFGEEVDQSAAFVDSAAIMVNLDLVITSDTALPHLAGALGVPVWLMLPKTPDWRWLLDRADSPYYSTMRLFRQEVANEWPGVIKQVIDALGQETLF